MKSNDTPRRARGTTIALTLAGLGSGIVIATSLLGEFSVSLLAFVAWALAPYRVLAAVPSS